MVTINKAATHIRT